MGSNQRNISAEAIKMSVLSTIRDELKQLGYMDKLLQGDYTFDDASYSGKRELVIPLAAFAQWPPSYRNACIGVLSANGQSGAQNVSIYRTLGAPMLFEAFPDRFNRYRVEATRDVVFLESIPARNISQAFKANKDKWNPETIFRAKAITPLTEPYQLDFVDTGLLPALKGMIHGKLDRLLKDILGEAIISYESALGAKPEEASLFRLVFRFLAAKIFKDRNHPGDWSAPGANDIIDRVQQFYGLSGYQASHILDEPNTQQFVWDKFRSAFNFQNLSVEDLAFIYENTLIGEETRKRFGVHSTPSAIAELMVDRLPFESLHQAGRYVLEPCAGHGVFLVAALRRLRELLPLSWGDQQRHKYLKEHLTAIEFDTFAAEVCRLSLMLADYPNPDGWQILSRDVFGSDILEGQLETSRIVLCNPPFEDFTQAERNTYKDTVKSVRKPYEVLRRVLEHPPDMLGFVLPKAAIMGGRYSDLQDKIARNYKNIETIALPDRIFAFSDQETMLVLASEKDEHAKANVSTRTFWVRENDRKSFVEAGRLPKPIAKNVKRSSHTKHVPLWYPALSEIWDYLAASPRFEDIAEIHRGIEWNIPLKKNSDILVSSNPRQGFKKGLAYVREEIEPFYAQRLVYLNMDEQYRRTNAHSLPWDSPKVIVNRFAVSRSPWRIMGIPDESGLVCRENFIGIWPKNDMGIEVISALVNSPLINAAMYTKEGKRLNRNSTLKRIPVPFPGKINVEKIRSSVIKYTKLRLGSKKHTLDEKLIEQFVKTVTKIDALVLEAYDLPPRLERKLLDFFKGYPRPFPFNFPHYFPSDFHPCIPLHKYLEMNLKQAGAGQLLSKIRPFDSKEMDEFFMDIEGRQS